MPRIPQPTREAVLRKQFAAGFRRSRRGNIWRKYDESTVTVFKRDDERFGWCISRSEDDVEFSPDDYASEEEAVDSVGAILL
jgi:hypothetical protein